VMVKLIAAHWWILKTIASNYRLKGLVAVGG
jgi:hypothetical protein